MTHAWGIILNILTKLPIKSKEIDEAVASVIYNIGLTKIEVSITCPCSFFCR